MLSRLSLGIAITWLAGMPAAAEEFLVRNQAEYARVIDTIEAGDTVTLADGEWRDFEMVVTGAGREDAPMEATATRTSWGSGYFSHVCGGPRGHRTFLASRTTLTRSRCQQFLGFQTKSDATH